MWKYAAARTTGASHLKRNQVCQDRFEVWSGEGLFLAAVADGAGSAACAEVGAEIAVSVALDSMRGRKSSQPWSDVLTAAAISARDAIVAKSKIDGRMERDFACTLLLIAMSPIGGAALQIGDGVIVLRDDPTSEWSWVFWPQKGEYANTTRFLTDGGAMEGADCCDLPSSVFEVAVMSDGLEALALNFGERVAYAPFFEGLLTPLRNSTCEGEIEDLSRGLEQFLASPRVADRADDDLTIVLAARPTV